MKKAFTLSEVLITMGIIGIVAAITLPVIINKINKRIIETQLKSFYSTFNNALTNYYNDNELSSFKDTIMGNEEISQTEKTQLLVDEFLKRYIKGKAQNITINYKYLYGGATIITYQYITDSGTTIGIKEGLWNSVQTIYFDVNGKKQPNIIGIDAFRFYIYEKPITLAAYKRLTDWDCHNCADSCRTDLNPEASGWGCWIRILQEGRITYY